MPRDLQKLPDPQGMIARVRRAMSPACAVRQSKYCDIIISMRMQGIPYRKIEEWLIEQGQEYRISAATLYRNLKKTKLTVELPYAEEIAEKYGGRIDLDFARELAGQIVAQRERVDAMQRNEKKVQEDKPHFFDRRLKGERELLASMIKQMAAMMKSPLEAAQETIEANALMGALTFKMTEDTATVLREMLLAGELKFGDDDLTFH